MRAFRLEGSQDGCQDVESDGITEEASSLVRVTENQGDCRNKHTNACYVGEQVCNCSAECNRHNDDDDQGKERRTAIAVEIEPNPHRFRPPFFVVIQLF